MTIATPLDTRSGVRLCILQTDSVLPQFQQEHGDYPFMFRRLLVRNGWPEAQLSCHDVTVDGAPAPGGADAYLITGSKRSVYEDEPWIAELADFLRTELDRGCKVVGICFGHQLLAHFFGGEVRPAPDGWQVGVNDVAVTARRPWMEPYLPRVALLSSHQDQVVRLPSAATALGGYGACPVGLFELGNQVLAIQGHPEFQKPYSAALLELRRELLGESVHNAGVRSLTKPTNGELIGQWIVRFLESTGASTEAQTL